MAHLSHHLNVSHKYVYFPYNSLENVCALGDERLRKRKKRSEINASHMLCFTLLAGGWWFCWSWSWQQHRRCMHKHMFIFLFRIIYETRRATIEQSLFHAINKSLPRRAAIYFPNVFTIENFLLRIFVSFRHWKWNQMNFLQHIPTSQSAN